MRFASLGSGSRGNATLVEHGDQRLLIDCGFSIKETFSRLHRLGVDPQTLTALLVTHEHSDHIKGVGPVARKLGLPVFMTPGTFRGRDYGVLPYLNLIEGYRPFQLGNIVINPVAVPHDSREPSQFIFEADGRRLGILTDLGSISSHVEDAYEHCDALVLEANHDPQMLASGPYPPSLKQRVGGLWGHLSNQQAAGFLQRINRQRLQQLVVAHISLKNNSVDRSRACLAEPTESIEQVIYACQEQGFDWLSIK